MSAKENLRKLKESGPSTAYADEADDLFEAAPIEKDLAEKEDKKKLTSKK